MAQPSHRDQLLLGAVECLKTKGYAHTTARDIATAAQANLASIGYHFGSKEALLNAALIELFTQRNRRVGQRVLSGAEQPPIDQLRTMFVAVDDVFSAPRPLFISFLEAITQAARSPELREQLATHYRDARLAVANSLRAMLGTDGVDGPDDAETMAALLMATFDGLVLQWLLDPDGVPDGAQLFDALRHMMAAAATRTAPVAQRRQGTPGAPPTSGRRSKARSHA